MAVEQCRQPTKLGAIGSAVDTNAKPHLIWDSQFLTGALVYAYFEARELIFASA